jgi:small nuclear ribonucleoprotein (snRNP)-like protein
MYSNILQGILKGFDQSTNIVLTVSQPKSNTCAV